MDEYFRRMLNLIDQYGIAIQGVGGFEGDDGPPFAYTVGLYEKHRFEVMIIGLPMQIAQKHLNDLHNMIKDGLEIIDGLTLRGIVKDLPVKFVQVTDRGDFTTGIADKLMNGGREVPLLQMVWPLFDGTWPDRNTTGQPLLGIL